MQRSKINDRFDFPTRIDISPYKVETLTDSDDKSPEDLFDLVGVLVHMGTAESGHYFSYIRPGLETSGEAAQWLEFNDADVSEFDPRRIADVCFGGWVDESDQKGSNAHQTILPKPWNAYMLFYQRISLEGRDSTTRPDARSKVAVPAGLQAEIARENDRRLREYCLFEPHHTLFVRNLVQQMGTLNRGMCSEDHKIERAAITLALEHFHQVVARTKDVPDLDGMIALLKKKTKACTRCGHVALGWIATSSYGMRDLLLRSPHPKVRSEFGHFIVQILRTIREEPALYGFDVSNTNIEGDEITTANFGIFPSIVESMKQHLHQLSLVARPWMTTSTFSASWRALGCTSQVIFCTRDIWARVSRFLRFHGMRP